VVVHGETSVPVENIIPNYQGLKNVLVCSSETSENSIDQFQFNRFNSIFLIFFLQLIHL
jgi:hypothetical protein